MTSTGAMLDNELAQIYWQLDNHESRITALENGGGGPDPDPGTWKPQFGTSLWRHGSEPYSQTLQRAEDNFGPIKCVRIFDSNNGWGAVENVANQMPTGMSLIVSSKDHTGFKDVLNRLQASRTGNGRVAACWMHEFDAKINEGSLTRAEYTTNVTSFMEGVKADCPGVFTTQIGMAYSFYDKQLNEKHYDELFIPELCDIYGTDAYNGDKDGYDPNPQPMLANWVEFCRDNGKPWLVGEWGCPVRNPGEEQQRADWLEQTGRYYAAQADCVAFAFFNSNVGGDGFSVDEDPLAQEALSRVAAL